MPRIRLQATMWGLLLCGLLVLPEQAPAFSYVAEAEGEAVAAAVAENCPAISILIDPQDALYGALGLALTPAVGIAEAQFRLAAYLPYRKINYQSIIRAQISYLLGDIDQEGLQAVLEPVPKTLDSTIGRARRGLKLARILLSHGKIVQARSQVDSALAVCPDLAEALELLAEIHNVEEDLAGAEAAAIHACFLVGSENSG